MPWGWLHVTGHEHAPCVRDVVSPANAESPGRSGCCVICPLNHKLDTVDHVRFTARLRIHASKMKISAGEVMELLLPTARRLHAQSVYETEAARVWDEDRRAADTSSPPEPLSIIDEGREPVAAETPDPVLIAAEPARTPTPAPRARSKSTRQGV